MRIAYFARIDLDKPSGVLKKILRQMQCWEEAGHEVQLFSLSRQFENYYSELGKFSFSCFQTKNYFDLLLKAISAERLIAEWDPDIVFWRYSSYYPLLKSIILNRFPTVADLNSNYDKEYKQIHNRFAYLFHRATKDRSFRNVAGFSTLTHELAFWLKDYKKPIAVIGDGINLKEIEPLPPANNDVPKLVCFASKTYPWIALDKIVFLANECSNMRFDIIGLNKSEVSEYVPPDNMTFHGFLPEQEYLRIISEADLAIGTLGLHRIGLQEMAPLKLREYLAFGLPTIIAYKDTDFISGGAFLLQLPNNEKNISEHIDKIKDFIWKWKGKRLPRELIQNIDISEKERIRLDFFERLVKGKM